MHGKNSFYHSVHLASCLAAAVLMDRGINGRRLRCILQPVVEADDLPETTEWRLRRLYRFIQHPELTRKCEFCGSIVEN